MESGAMSYAPAVVDTVDILERAASLDLPAA